MNLLQDFFRDPVIFFSFTGLAIVLAMCVFYAFYFIKKMNNETPVDEKK